MRDPVTDLNTRGRIIFASVLIFAVLHALLYVVTVPTWDLFDEEQHLSYALYLIDDGAIPHVNDPVQPRILESAVATDRWSTLRIGRPVAPELNEFGLEGWSYEGYHPPLYYSLIAPLTLLSGNDAWRELYAARLLGIALLFGYSVRLLGVWARLATRRRSGRLGDHCCHRDINSLSRGSSRESQQRSVDRDSSLLLERSWPRDCLKIGERIKRSFSVC